MKDQMVRQHEQNCDWQSQFMQKYELNQTKVVHELEETVERVVKNQNEIFNLQQTTSELTNKTTLHAETIQKHEAWLHKLQHLANGLEIQKLGVKDFALQKQRLEIEMDL